MASPHRGGLADWLWMQGLMQKLFAEQLAKAKTPSGEIDIDALGRLVVAAYEGMDAARRGAEHSIAAMVEEVNQAHRQLSEAFDIIPEGLVVLDAEGRFVHWNRRFAEIYDTARDKIVVGGSFGKSPCAPARNVVSFRMRSGAKKNG